MRTWVALAPMLVSLSFLYSGEPVQGSEIQLVPQEELVEDYEIQDNTSAFELEPKEEWLECDKQFLLEVPQDAIDGQFEQTPPTDVKTSADEIKEVYVTYLPD